ncbi:MAG: hypothetical protein L0H64_18220 [Pseudonocardia sp.]|nr:hypothetical protein [Pseudonocardia sp.]
MVQISVSASLRRVRAVWKAEADDVPPLEADDRWRGDGPVVLVGGWCTTDPTLAPLRSWLERLGYSVTTHTDGAGMGCAARSTERLRDVVRAAGDGGRGVRLLGYSRGGQFARVVAQDPELPIRSLVTLGTPFDLLGVSRPLMVQVAAVAVAGTLGVPRLTRLSCLYGACCAGFRGLLRGPVPVPFTTIYSRQDRLVRWQACVDPTAGTVEVPGSHLGLLTDQTALRAVARSLHRGDVPVAAGN